MPLPLLVVVAGPPGSGTTTLAHELSRAIPCPAICRDEIKEGLVQSLDGYTHAYGDAEAYRTMEIFFGVVGYLVDAGVRSSPRPRSSTRSGSRVSLLCSIERRYGSSTAARIRR
ncbi:MAG TPA: hypothetical protein VHK46_06530 [Gaiellaceae bacterium]|nr:hypothetical protein [Gaiellaceae bacterium]